MNKAELKFQWLFNEIQIGTCMQHAFLPFFCRNKTNLAVWLEQLDQLINRNVRTCIADEVDGLGQQTFSVEIPERWEDCFLGQIALKSSYLKFYD
jgi:hypothetical protein